MSLIFDDDEVVSVLPELIDASDDEQELKYGPVLSKSYCHTEIHLSNDTCFSDHALWNKYNPIEPEPEQAPAPIPIVQDNKCVPVPAQKDYTVPASGPPIKVRFNNCADFMIQKESKHMMIYGFTLPADICSTPPFKNARATKMAKYIRIAGDTAFMEKHAHLSTKEFLAKTRKLRLPSYLPPVGDFYNNDIVPFNLSEDLFYMGQGLNRPYPLV
jgi:hypothetical protein